MAKDLSIAREFKRRAVNALPRRVAKVVLYGSRARGDARKDSDWDVAVFINGQPTRRDRTILSHISFDMMMETGQHVQAMPVPLSRADSTFSFYTNVRTDGVTL